MSGDALLVLMVLILLVAMFAGVDIATAMGVSAMAYLLIVRNVPFEIVPQKLLNGIDSFPMLAVPLFMLAGELMNQGSVTLRLVRFSQALIGHVQGGLAQVAVVANMIMSGMSGSAAADAAATGSVLIPAMKRAGYNSAFSAAVIASAATIGPIIPPSTIFVILGSMLGISIGQLFLGGAVPGLLMGLSLMVMVHFISKRANLPKGPRATRAELVGGIKDGFLSLLMPLFVIGSMISGIATPTEAAVIGVWYALFLGVVIYRDLTPAKIWRSFVETGILSASVMITIGAATIFGWVATAEQLGPKVAGAILGITTEPIYVLLLINIVLLILGTVGEPIPLIVILMPILFPMVTALGIDPIHFGVMVTLNLTIGMITPPVGLNLYVVSRISGDGLVALTKAIWPFIIMLVAVLMLITYVPILTLFLPRLLMGGG